MKILDIIQGTPEWHAWRATGIGASESPALFQESPYITERELYLTKKGLLQKDSGSEYIFQRGHDAEAKMRGEIFAVLGSTFEPVCIQSPVHEWMLASLDGYSDSFGILEAKLVGKEVLKAALKGELPRHHWIQMQHQMIASNGVTSGKYFCSDLSNNGAIVDVELDKEFGKLLVEKGNIFWENFKKNIAPALSAQDVLIIEEAEELSVFEKLRFSKGMIDTYQKDYDDALALIKSKYSHPKISGANVKLTLVERAGSISYAKIPELKNLPAEYLEKFRGQASKYFKVTIGDEA